MQSADDGTQHHIQNTGAEAIGLVTVTATALNDQGTAVDTRKLEGLLTIVPAGGKVPYSGAMDARDAVKYTLQVEAKPAPAAPQNKLEVENESATEPKAGYVWLSGEVKNSGTVAAKSVQVIGVLYNEKGGVVDAARQDLEGTLAPGATAAFKFNVNHRDSKTHVLMAQGEDGQ